MDFSQIKKLSISGIELRQLFVGGIQVWKSGYKNLIETATAEPGGTEIYGGTGYKDGKRWSLSGGKESDAASARLSGWIHFTPGATYRVKNFYAQYGYNNGLYFVLWNSDGSVSVYHFDYQNTPNYASYNLDTDTWMITLTSNEAQYFRLSGFKGAYEPIVTMNEEIPG